jgi:hypothetical protein
MYYVLLTDEKGKTYLWNSKINKADKFSHDDFVRNRTNIKETSAWIRINDDGTKTKME